MNCPQCSIELQKINRKGVQIDFCPECRGVWLDRGELDKLIEHAAAEAQRLHTVIGEGDPPKSRPFLSDLFDWE